MPEPIAHRSAREVLRCHLAHRQEGHLDADLRENYAADVVVLSAEGVSRGHDGVRRLAEVLRTYVPAGKYRYLQVLVDGSIGMLLWRARDSDTVVHDGADSYLIRDGLIRAQTIHYSTRETGREGAGASESTSPENRSS